jgi:3,4-dihydroxyphenylacetate 2,3-dioxygenase
MGNLALAAKITHVPTMVLSEKDGPFKDCRKPAIDSLKSLGDKAREIGVDTFVVVDTHWLVNIGFHVNANTRHTGVYTSHEIPHLLQDIAYDYPGDPSLGEAIAAAAPEVGLEAHAHKVPTLQLEYGTLLPMRYMNPDSSIRVVSVASPLFTSIEENRRFGEAIRLGVERSGSTVALLASGSLSHKLWDNEGFDDQSWFTISSEFNKQMDLRVLELWRERRYKEFLEMLPEYSKKCNGEGLMADTAMLFGALGWSDYHGQATELCPYFEATGSGQVNVEFAVTN